jgi:type II secretory pathway component PulC
MNIQRWKGTLWLVSLVTGGALAYLVYDFLQKNTELAKEVPEEVITKVLDSVKKPEEQRTDAVDYKDVKLVFHEYDWTGKEKPKPAGPANKGPEVPKYTPVKDLLKVLALKVDMAKAENSRAYVTFLGPLAAHNDKKNATVLKVGGSLPSPHNGVSVAEITPAGVVFAFEDQARARETLTTSRAQGQIVVVGPEGLIKPQSEGLIPSASPDLPPYRPEQTVQIKKNEFQIGTQTLTDLDRDYSRILSQDVSYSTYRNPKTGQNEGIKISRVAPGSIPAQAGLTEGEVLKSINGHRVTSVNDAIAFVKANSETTDVWTAVFEKQGREFTRTYHSPPR